MANQFEPSSSPSSLGDFLRWSIMVHSPNFWVASVSWFGDSPIEKMCVLSLSLSLDTWIISIRGGGGVGRIWIRGACFVSIMTFRRTVSMANVLMFPIYTLQWLRCLRRYKHCEFVTSSTLAIELSCRALVLLYHSMQLRHHHHRPSPLFDAAIRFVDFNMPSLWGRQRMVANVSMPEDRCCCCCWCCCSQLSGAQLACTRYCETGKSFDKLLILSYHETTNLVCEDLWNWDHQWTVWP